MANVKPGDLARVIYDPSTAYGGDNVGKQVHVVDHPKAANAVEEFIIAKHQREHGKVWVCKPLQPIWSQHAFGAPRELSMALCLIPDSHVRRIDPPADSSDLMSTEPLPGEAYTVTREGGLEIVHIDIKEPNHA